jgi:hypothetical protein
MDKGYDGSNMYTACESRDIRPVIPLKALYRTRGAVERGFGRLKHEWGMLPLRARRLPRVRLPVDLTILPHLACALAKARAASPSGITPAHSEPAHGGPLGVPTPQKRAVHHR